MFLFFLPLYLCLVCIFKASLEGMNEFALSCPVSVKGRAAGWLSSCSGWFRYRVFSD